MTGYAWRFAVASLVVIVTAVAPVRPNELRERDCRRLLAATDATTAILSAEVVAATESLPQHCRIEGLVLPAVGFEVRLPSNWNGKFFMVGNGGYLGAFFDPSMGLGRGYATASTDTGHRGTSPTFAHDNRVAEIDYAFRAVHVTALVAKKLIETFYGRPPRTSYFRGCSTGGRQGLMEAQRFPDDFDGLSIGAPIYDYTQKQTFNAAWVAQALFGNDAAGYVRPRQLETLGRAVYSRCDGVDGLVDGLIDDPRRCDFDPSLHLERCSEEDDGDDCFSAAQLEAVAKIYAGPGADIYPGHVPGGEWMAHPDSRFAGGWDVYFVGSPPSSADSVGADRDAYGGSYFEPVQLRNARTFFRFLAFETDLPDFDVLTDLDFADPPDTRFMAALMNASDSDLGALQARGGKVLLWHGWADVGLNPLRTIDYYEAVRETLGEERAGSMMRLFMVPGMYHCSGGPGPDRFDDLTALERWVEIGIPPEVMIARKLRGDVEYAPGRGPGGMARGTAGGEVVRSRPLCPYPRVARYKGAGSIDEAESFECRPPE